MKGRPAFPVIAAMTSWGFGRRLDGNSCSLVRSFPSSSFSWLLRSGGLHTSDEARSYQAGRDSQARACEPASNVSAAQGVVMVRSRVFVTLLVILVFLGALICWAQESNVPSESQTNAPQGYPVVLGNQTLFTITQEVKGYSPEERANGMSERITRIADDPGIPVSAVNTAQFRHTPLNYFCREQSACRHFRPGRRGCGADEGGTCHEIR